MLSDESFELDELRRKMVVIQVKEQDALRRGLHAGKSELN